MRPHRDTPVVRHGAKISPTVIKPFTFSKLELTGRHAERAICERTYANVLAEVDDDDAADPNDPRAREIGTIRVELKYVKIFRKVPIVPCDPEDAGPVHEKAKKAGVHQTTHVRATQRSMSKH